MNKEPFSEPHLEVVTPVLLSELVKVSFGKRIQALLRTTEPTEENNIPVLGAGVKTLGYISQSTHQRLYHVLEPEEVLIVSRVGHPGRTRYFKSLHSIAPTDDTFILQVIEPEKLYIKYLYYKLLSMEEEFMRIAGGSVLRHIHITDIRNIILGYEKIVSLYRKT